MTSVNPAQLQRSCSCSMARHRRWAGEEESLPQHQAEDSSLGVSITPSSATQPQVDWSQGAPPPLSQHPPALGGHGELGSLSAIREAGGCSKSLLWEGATGQVLQLL